MNKIREKRLNKEFERMKELREAPHRLLDFLCAPLSVSMAEGIVKGSISLETIANGLGGFLTPEAFSRRYPDTPPEKYLIIYACTGLLRTAEGEIEETSSHAMEVSFGWEYPTSTFLPVWLTPIWHPNFKPPYVCGNNRPGTADIKLDVYVRHVGEMIQYRNYDLKDDLNKEATAWVLRASRPFPVDDRDLLDSRRRVRSNPAAATRPDRPVVELIEDA